MKKTIENFDLKDKKVIIRVDFNVPIKMVKFKMITVLNKAQKLLNMQLKNKLK